MGDKVPIQSFLLAAKYDFLSEYIKTGSLVCVSSNIRTTTDVCEYNVCTASQNVYNAEEHTRLTNDKRYRCDWCHKGFSRKYHLTRHKHFHSAEQTYKCGTCDEQFTTLSHLKNDKLIHDGVMSHECGKCHTQFQRASPLNIHDLIMHPTISPYEVTNIMIVECVTNTF